jgi:hypothetical protein
MNKKTIVASLAEIANELDNNNLHKEASDITKIMVKVAQKADANQVVYNVMKRKTGRPDYNKMNDLGEFITQNYSDLVAAVKEEAERLNVPASDAIMRLDKASKITSNTFTMPIRNKQPGVGVPPSTVSPDQSTGEMESEDDRKYRQEKLPIFNLAKAWIKKFGKDGPSMTKLEATKQFREGKMSIEKYKAIVELLDRSIMKTPARKVPMGPFRREK